MPCSRKIASNLLLTAAGEVVRDPLVELAADGTLSAIRRCAAADREPFTAFYAGLLVPGFPADYRAAFEALQKAAPQPLQELLPPLLDPQEGVLVLLSGLDYERLTLTPRSEICKL